MAWKIILRTLYARRENQRLELKGTSRSPVPFRVSRSACDKTGRTRRITRPKTRCQQQSSRSKGSYGSDVSSPQQSKIHGLLDEGLGTRKDDPGAGQPELRGDSRSKEDKESSFKSRTRGSVVPQRLEKSKETTRASRTKLTIRDPSDKESGISQGVSTSQTLASTASHEETLVTSSNGSKPETRGGARNPLRRPRVTAKSFDLGKALLDAAPQPVGISNQRDAPDAKTPVWGRHQRGHAQSSPKSRR